MNHYKKKLLLFGLATTLGLSSCGKTNETDAESTIESLSEENESLKEILYSENIEESILQRLDLLEQQNKLLVASLQQDYKPTELDIIVINDGSGHPQYHFVEGNFEGTEYFNAPGYFNDYSVSQTSYLSVTNPNLFYQQYEYVYDGDILNSCSNIPVLYSNLLGLSVPDYTVQTALLNPVTIAGTMDFIMPKEYDLQSTYSVEDLKNIEQILGEPTYNIYNYFNILTYDSKLLKIFKYHDQYFIIYANLYVELYENPDLENADTNHRVRYVYSISNPENAIKCRFEPVYEYQKKYDTQGDSQPLYIEKFTSSNREFIESLGDYHPGDIETINDITPYLTGDLENKTTLTYDEVIALEKQLNQEKQHVLTRTIK